LLTRGRQRPAGLARDGIIRTVTATDVARRIIGTLPATDVTGGIVHTAALARGSTSGGIIGTAALANVTGGIVGSPALTDITRRIISAATRHRAGRASQGCKGNDGRQAGFDQSVHDLGPLRRWGVHGVDINTTAGGEDYSRKNADP
jgi:hypothetical protein